jgi:hypothetical protein
MQLRNPLPRARATLLIVWIAAVAQGWALYGLHLAIKHQRWPATDVASLLGLYSVAFLVPVTVQLFADYAKRLVSWLMIVIVGSAFFYFGWHHGSSVTDIATERLSTPGDYFPLAFVLLVLWLHILPFLQARLAMGQWTVEYRLLFINAWRNALTLAEATLFTGLFWLLLFLWQMLFHLLRIDFFRELFEEPLFAYPVTSLIFGLAVHLVGSVDPLISAVLEQILNVLKWLATVAGLLLAFFTTTLLFKLSGLIFAGEKAIGAAWLLWLVAVVILFLNAAFRDGSVERPYPHWIAVALRLVVPLTLVVAFTALYALIVRTQQYGLTVERVWAFIVAGAAMMYSIGYSIAAIGSARWFAGIARVNVIVALALIGAISAALTPLLSPYRLAADSQYRFILEGHFKTSDPVLQRNSPFHYLRFDAGRYGRSQLKQLAELQNHPNAEHIRLLAAEASKLKSPWGVVPPIERDALLSRLVIYPTGMTLDSDLSSKLSVEWNKTFRYSQSSDQPIAGIFVDLNGDGVDEFVLLNGTGGVAFQNQDGVWKPIGQVFAENPGLPWKTLPSDLTPGNVVATVPRWKELSVGSHRFRINDPGFRINDPAEHGTTENPAVVH